MADESISRILDKLDELSERTARLDERVTGLSEKIDKYNNVTGRTAKMESAIELMQQKCQGVQEAKKSKSINWGSIFTYIAGAIILALVMKYLPI